MTYYMSIDPGKDGGIVVLDEAFKIINADVMPLLHGELDPGHLYSYFVGLFSEVLDADPNHVFLEKAQAMPKNGGVSMFNYGVGFGYLEMAINALGIPYTLVTPKQWQKTQFMGTKATLPPKARAAAVVSRLGVASQLKKTPNAKAPHEGMVDAYLLCRHGMRVLNGGAE